MPLAGAVAARWALRVPRFMAYSMIGATVAMAVFLVVAVSQTLTGWATRLFPTGWNDVTRDLVNWTELRTELQARGLLGATAIVAAPHWIQAGKVSYALGPSVEVLCLCERPQHFAYRYNLADFAGARRGAGGTARRAGLRRRPAPVLPLNRAGGAADCRPSGGRRSRALPRHLRRTRIYPAEIGFAAIPAFKCMRRGAI